MSAMGMLFTVFGEARLVPGRIRVHAAIRGRDPVRRSPTLRTVAPQSAALMTRSAQLVGVLNWPLAVEREVRQQQAVGREWQQLQRREPLGRLLAASDGLRLRSCGALR